MRRVHGLLGVVAIAAAGPAAARPVATARVVSCEAGDCLLVHGRRSDPGATVEINGRPVAVAGGGAWTTRLPVATLRDWSAPFARTMRIAIVDPAGPVERAETVRLPIGLLGGRIELASLTVRAR